MTPSEMKAARINRGLGLREAASLMGVSRETLRQVEMGYRPTPAVAKRIADFHEVLVTDIWPVDPTPAEAAA